MTKELMDFQQLDQDALREMLEEKDALGRPVHVDVLTGLAEKERAFFAAASCPRCQGTNLEAFIDPARPFISGNPLPNRHLRCLTCRTEFDPYSGLILRATSAPGSRAPR